MKTPKVHVEMMGPLMGDDFIPHKQLIITFSAEDIQDWATTQKHGKKEIKKLILDAVDDKLNEVIRGRSIK